MSSLEYILFVAGEIPLATPASSVRCIHDSLQIQSEPGTHEWFLGLAIADSQLLPVSDLGAYLTGKASLGRIIEVSRSIGLAALRVDVVNGVSRAKPIAVAEPADVTLDSTASFDSTGSYVVRDKEQEHRVINLTQLLLSDRFNTIAKPSRPVSSHASSQPPTRTPA